MVIKAVVDEDYSSEARTLLTDFGNGRFDLYAPRMLIFEIASALYKLTRLKLLSKEYSLSAFASFTKIPFTYLDLAKDELVKTLAAAIESRITFCDAVYVIVSEKTNSTLITADEDMVKKAGRLTKVLHIMNYKK